MALRVLLLLVEDDDEDARLLQIATRELGLTIRTATTIAAAKQILEAEKHEAILTDLGLPDGQGLDAVEQLVHYGLPLLVVTGNQHPGQVEAAIRAGAVGLVCKSATPKEIRNRIVEFIRYVQNKRKTRIDTSLLGELERRLQDFMEPRR